MSDEKSTNPLISVVVPLYNGSKYLPKMLESLKNQTYYNFEALFINDFSTDNSADLIKQYAENDQRFILIERTFKGGNAVKGIEYGLPYCKGDYYFFMTQDDFIDSDLFEKAVSKAEETGADIVLPDYCFYRENAQSRKASKYPINGDYSQILPSREAFYLSLNWQIGGFSLRKMDLVKEVGVKADYFNSCEFYTRLNYLRANKIAFCNSMFYYRKDNNDAINVGCPYYMFDVFKTDLMLLNELIINNFSRKQISTRLKRIIKDITHWRKDYKKSYTSYNEEQRKYVYDLIKSCEKEVFYLCLKRLDFMNLLLYFSKIFRNQIKEIYD